MDMTGTSLGENTTLRTVANRLGWLFGLAALCLGLKGFWGHLNPEPAPCAPAIASAPTGVNCTAQPQAMPASAAALSPPAASPQGSAAESEKPSWVHQGRAALLTTLQLFVLNVSAETVDRGGVMGWIAAFLAPVSTTVAVALAFWPALTRRLLLWSLRLKGPDEVFIGAGDQARAIIAQLLQSRQPGAQPLRLAVLDTAPSNAVSAWLAQQRDGVKIFSFTADARAAHMLKAAGVRHLGTRIWILTGSDACNVEILRQVLALRPGQASPVATCSGADSIQPVLVAVRDESMLRSTLDLWPHLAQQGGVEWLHLPRLAALRLLQLHPPRFPQRHVSHSLHLAVVGRSEWVEALLLYLCHHAVYAPEPERALHISLIAPDAQAQLQQLYARHPLLDPQHRDEALCKGMLPLAHIYACDAQAEALLPSQWQALQHPSRGGVFETIYVAEAHDESSFNALRRLAALRDVHAAATGESPGPSLVVYANDRLARDPHDNGQWPAFARVFDVYRACFGDGKRHPYADLDQLAMWVDFGFERCVDPTRRSDPNLAKQALDLWDQKLRDGRLVKAFLWSSRYAASHAQVKVALNAFKGDQTEPGDKWLGRLENRRYAVERLLWNWLPLKGAHVNEPPPSGLPYQQSGPGSNGRYEPDQKSLLNLNKTLVPHVALPGSEVQKDLAIVATTLGAQSQPSSDSA